MTGTTLYRAAKYIRLSYSDDSTIESDSVGNQRRILDAFIAANPDIFAEYEAVDDGVSGILFDRPAFKRMMTEIEEGRINCVIVKDLSRLGREYIETGRYLQRIFPAYGVRFIAINDNIDTLKESADDLVVSVKSVINDAYCRDISIKTRTALSAKRANGDYVGACPVYGYRKSEENHNLLIVDESPTNVIRDIFRMKIDGMSAMRIAEELNRLGILSPLAYKKSHGLPHPTKGFADREDAMWSAIAVLRILQNEIYTGTLVQGRVGTINYKLKELIRRPESEWKRVLNTHEAIISKRDFDLVQRLMRLDTRIAPGSTKLHLFSAILICGCCGSRMTRRVVNYKDVQYTYYCCPNTRAKGCTKGVSLRADCLHDLVLAAIKVHIVNVAALETILEKSDAHKVTLALTQQLSSQIEDVESQLERICNFRSTLYENMVGEIITKEDYCSFREKYNADEKRLRAALQALQHKREQVKEGNEERLRWMEHFRNFESMTELDRRSLVTLVQSIRVLSKTSLEIAFNYQDEYDSICSVLATEAV